MKLTSLIAELTDCLAANGDLDVLIDVDQSGYKIDAISISPKTIVDEDGFEDASDENYCFLMGVAQ